MEWVELVRYGVKYCDKTSFLDDEQERCTGASACCLDQPKNEKLSPIG